MRPGQNLQESWGELPNATPQRPVSLAFLRDERFSLTSGLEFDLLTFALSRVKAIITSSALPGGVQSPTSTHKERRAVKKQKPGEQGRLAREQPEASSRGGNSRALEAG